MSFIIRSKKTGQYAQEIGRVDCASVRAANAFAIFWIKDAGLAKTFGSEAEAKAAINEARKYHPSIIIASP